MDFQSGDVVRFSVQAREDDEVTYWCSLLRTTPEPEDMRATVVEVLSSPDRDGHDLVCEITGETGSVRLCSRDVVPVREGWVQVPTPGWPVSMCVNVLYMDGWPTRVSLMDPDGRYSIAQQQYLADCVSAVVGEAAEPNWAAWQPTENPGEAIVSLI
jgi:hypothetical protein